MKTFQAINFTKMCVLWGFDIPLPKKDYLNVMLTNTVYIRLKKDGKTSYKRNGDQFITTLEELKDENFILIKGRY